ncbi:MAG: N-acetyltransferase family protein [Beijerinckiaceae bacterium]
MSHSAQFRGATASDVPALLDLMVISSWGGIREAWSRAAMPGETWQQRGIAELADARCEIGYSRFVVAHSKGRIAGMVLLNLVGDTSTMDPSREPPEQAGAVALIKEARHSLFIREFAIAEWARGEGLAKEFLRLTEQLTLSNNLRRVTLIVNDANAPAHTLYAKAGYTQIHQEPSIGHPSFPDSSMLLLMEKGV